MLYRPWARWPCSQVLGNLLELPELGALVGCHRSGRRREATVDVVVNEGPLRIRNRLFDRVQLLGELQTRAPGFNHLDDAAQVPFGAPQPLHNVRMCLMES